MTAAIHSYALDWFWICHTRKHCAERGECEEVH